MQHAAAKINLKGKSIPDKLFYKIGEVSRITSIEPYVLRYWESEFAFLKPRKSRSGQRIYIRKDLELILKIKELLYQERYTIEGVRKRLGEGGAVERPESTDKLPSDSNALEYVKRRLREILGNIN